MEHAGEHFKGMIFPLVVRGPDVIAVYLMMNYIDHDLLAQLPAGMAAAPVLQMMQNLDWEDISLSPAHQIVNSPFYTACIESRQFVLDRIAAGWRPGVPWVDTGSSVSAVPPPLQNESARNTLLPPLAVSFRHPHSTLSDFFSGTGAFSTQHPDASLDDG